jgi:hypothetical protein
MLLLVREGRECLLDSTLNLCGGSSGFLQDTECDHEKGRVRELACQRGCFCKSHTNRGDLVGAQLRGILMENMHVN